MAFFSCQEWILLAGTFCVLFYMYVSRRLHYWKKQHFPSEPFSLIWGSTLSLLFKPQHELDRERYEKYGRFFGAFEGGKPMLFVAEPDLVKQVLVKDFSHMPSRRITMASEPLISSMMTIATGEQWRRVRRAASPAFTTGKLRKMNYLIEECAQVTLRHLRKAASNEEDVDIKQFFGNYSLDVIARCAFATEVDSHSDQTNEFVTKTRQSFSGRVTPRLLLIFAFPTIANMLGLRLSTSDSFVFLIQTCQSIIKRRRQRQERHEDFLQLMMDAQDGKVDGVTEIVSDHDNQIISLDSEVRPDTAPSSNKALTADEAMAQCLTFLVAGQDTVSTAAAHTLYLLAIHPEVQEKLRAEADECFATNGDHPSLDVVAKLKYLHCVVSESLRMYPPAARIERTAHEDYVLGDTGVTIKKGDMVAIPLYAMHRDTKYFHDPCTFDPERFNEENVQSIQPYTYLPFGAGPRNCVGMRFALQAVKLCILHTVHNVQLVRTDKTKVPLEFHNGAAILTAKDITVGIRKRS